MLSLAAAFVLLCIVWPKLVGFAVDSYLKAWAMIPSAHYGVVYRLRRRTGKILDEGEGWIIPWIESVRAVNKELRTKTINGSFLLGDTYELFFEGSLSYAADPYIYEIMDKLSKLYYQKRNKFVAVAETAIVTGISDAIKRVLRDLGGTCDVENFIKMGPAIGMYINCLLRLGPKEQPYLNHVAGLDSPTCGVEGCTKPKEIEIEDRLAFYKSHWKVIRDLLADEKTRTESHSEIELRFGIDNEVYELAKIDLTDEAKRARNAKILAEEKKKAGASRLLLMDEVVGLANKHNILLSPAILQLAADHADRVLNADQVKKDISSRSFNISGVDGLAGAIVSMLKGGAD